ncbi:MAG: hypothetical protein ACE5IM_04050 [Nitrospinota bacterium]
MSISAGGGNAPQGGSRFSPVAPRTSPATERIRQAVVVAVEQKRPLLAVLNSTTPPEDRGEIDLQV